jgi:hypothetical protein
MYICLSLYVYIYFLHLMYLTFPHLGLTIPLLNYLSIYIYIQVFVYLFIHIHSVYHYQSSVYRVSKEERSIFFCEAVVSAILSKNVYMCMCPI